MHLPPDSISRTGSCENTSARSAMYISMISLSTQIHCQNITRICGLFYRLFKMQELFSKTCLYIDKIEFLGDIISSSRIEVRLFKVQRIVDRSVLRSPAEIRAFNSLVNYVAEFIPALADYLTMLSHLTWKGGKFE